MTKKKNILFGAVDIGFRISHYSAFIKENFPEVSKVESFSKYVLPKSHFITSYTYECPVDKFPKWKVYLYSFLFFIKTLFTYDVIHFFSGETLLTRKLRTFELWTYKLLGKKVIIHFVGADIRSEKFLEEKRNNLVEYLKGKPISEDLSEAYQKRLIGDARKYASRIIVSTPDLLEIIPEADYIPVFLDLKSIDLKLNEPKSNTDKIKILHSPSGFHTKGSEYIHEVLKRIIEKNKDVEIITPFNGNSDKKAYALTRYELLNAFKEVDVIVDQMLIGWYGLKSIEALALGIEVVCFIDEKFKNSLFENTPIHSASILNLEEELQNLINKLTIKKERSITQEKNITWIEKYHDINSYKAYFYNLWIDK